MQVSKKQKKQMVMILAVSAGLAVIMGLQGYRQDRADIEQGILRGQNADEIFQEVYTAKTEDGASYDVPVTVYPEELTDAACRKVLDQAVEEFEACYLGENPSADAVCQNLAFPETLCDGLVQAEYDTDSPELLGYDGLVTEEYLTEAGVVVTIQAVFRCQNQQMLYQCSVRLVAPTLTGDAQKQAEIQKSVEEKEAAERGEKRFVLPQTIAGMQVEWKKQPDLQWCVLLLLGAVGAICILQKGRQDEKQQRQKREQRLLQEYPQMVTQMSLLIGAGMTIGNAWERMVRRYVETKKTAESSRQERLYLEEMLLSFREMKEGKHIRHVYEDFGRRINLPCYRTFSAILVQSLDKGMRDSVRMLEAELDAAVESQRRGVRKQGEEAGTKLLLPMFLLFLMILIIVVVPAMQSF